MILEKKRKINQPKKGGIKPNLIKNKQDAKALRKHQQQDPFRLNRELNKMRPKGTHIADTNLSLFLNENQIKALKRFSQEDNIMSRRS